MNTSKKINQGHDCPFILSSLILVPPAKTSSTYIHCPVKRKGACGTVGGTVAYCVKSERKFNCSNPCISVAQEMIGLIVWCAFIFTLFVTPTFIVLQRSIYSSILEKKVGMYIIFQPNFFCSHSSLLIQKRQNSCRFLFKNNFFCSRNESYIRLVKRKREEYTHAPLYTRDTVVLSTWIFLVLRGPLQKT